ncbi:MULTISPECIES: hypothetical protein [Candidatus Ichthyocystis]|uniref:hypothetical protein n=2 Tax=Burkholderiales genera incertae sedis TaxID=224471 RepID=UPI000B835F35|nr:MULTISPECIES: hypothetical protein [Ichthyocystis]
MSITRTLISPLKLGLLLSVLLLTACKIFDDDTPSDNYIGSLPIKDSTAFPVGMTLDGSNGLIVTALGPETIADPLGRIFTVGTTGKAFDRATISAAVGKTYAGLSGSVFDPSNNLLYSCSNSKVPGVMPAVIVFERSANGSFTWKTASNFTSNGYCHSLAKTQGYLFATNSRPQTPKLTEIAVYSVNITSTSGTSSNLPPTLNKSLTYADIGYKSGDMLLNRDLITDVQGSQEKSGSNNLYLVDTKRNQLLYVNFIMMPSTAIVKQVWTDMNLQEPIAMAQMNDNLFAISEKNYGDPRITEVYYDSYLKPHYKVLASVSSTVSALSFGSDYFGKVQGPVVFALRTESQLGIFYVDEFSL